MGGRSCFITSGAFGDTQLYTVQTPCDAVRQVRQVRQVPKFPSSKKEWWNKGTTQQQKKGTKEKGTKEQKKKEPRKKKFIQLGPA